MSNPQSIVTNEDNMTGMARYPDKHFDLAIVDPPYGIEADRSKQYVRPRRPNAINLKAKHAKKGWDTKPENEDYFYELFRVSKNQIIFGANHFISRMPFDSSCWVVWDKNMGGDYADCELAWTSFNSSIRKYFAHPFIGTNGGKDRIHPTQKPIKLYTWLLDKYAKPGDKILDTHLGSGSSRIAAHQMGFDFTGFELDKDYFDAQEKRFNLAIQQQTLF